MYPNKGDKVTITTNVQTGAETGEVKYYFDEQCTAPANEIFDGQMVYAKIIPSNGYEAAKLNINGATVALTRGGDGSATAAVTCTANTSVDAWADPAEGKLAMNAFTEKPAFDTITNFGTLPSQWSDNDTTGRYDFKGYGGMAIFDAEAGSGQKGDRYKIDKIISYAAQDMNGRAHFKVFGTNEELSADMFTSANGANSGSEKLTALTHGNNDAFFGTGSFDNNRSGGIDSVRGEYAVNGDASYRYTCTLYSCTCCRI